MEIADKSDLELEQWLRQRNSGQIMWKTKDGRNGELHIQYGRSIDHFFRKVDYVQISCRVGSQIRVLVMDCAGFSIETTQTKKDNGFIEYKPKNFVVHLK